MANRCKVASMWAEGFFDVPQWLGMNHFIFAFCIQLEIKRAKHKTQIKYSKDIFFSLNFFALDNRGCCAFTHGPHRTSINCHFSYRNSFQ